MALGLKHFYFYIYLIFHRVQVLLRTRHFNMLVIPQIFIMCWKRFRDVSCSQEVYLKYRVNRKTNRKYIETKLCLQSSLNKCCSGDQFPGKKRHESLLSCHHTHLSQSPRPEFYMHSTRPHFLSPSSHSSSSRYWLPQKPFFIFWDDTIFENSLSFRVFAQVLTKMPFIWDKSEN